MSAATLQLPTVQKAIIQAKEPLGSLILCTDRSIPELRPEQVLLKIIAVALNPCDWKMPENFPCPGTGDGADFAGIIIATGSAIASERKIGDRVAGCLHASNPLNPQTGAFAEYIAVAADQVWRIPDRMPWEQAAALGFVSAGSVGLALFPMLTLAGSPEQPIEKPIYVLVYGGSSATGTMAIQLLSLSGYKVITTCSPKNFKLVESYGAEKAFDYNSPTCSDDIRAYTKNTLQYVLDIITEAKTMRLCYAAIGRAGGRYLGFEAFPDELVAELRKAVKAEMVLGFAILGEEVAHGSSYVSNANQGLREWACEWYKRFEVLVGSGKIRAHPPNVTYGGLEAILLGLDKMRRREVSGEKLVYVLNSEPSS